MESHLLKSAIDRFGAAHILCVGDILLDRYIYGDVERISPEAPVPVLHVQREVEMLGGIGNVARNVVALSAHAEILSVLGDDAAGRRTSELVGELNGCRTRPLVEAGRVSIEKTRCLTGRQQIVRLDRELVAPISDESMQELLRRYRALIGQSTAVVISDYAKGVLRPDFLECLIQIGRDHDKPVIVDPKGRDYARYRGADILTPNRNELALATGLPVSTSEQIVRACEELMERYDIQAVIATLGKDGMLVVQRNAGVGDTGPRSAVGDSGRHFAELKATARDVFDVSGAGDTATSCLAVALSAGLPLIAAAELANAAAGLVVEKMGTAVITTDELSHFCQMSQFRESEPKIKSWSEVAELSRRWRAKGLSVGFTNGCFDLLHPGHVQMLAQARRLCDRLIVGLNSDASVRRLKGPQRPVQNELSRATVIGALACVDAVVPFEQDAPAELVEVIRPDVMIKGKDYRVEQIAGAAFVLSHGGRVELIDLVPEQSTTRLVAELVRVRDF